MVILALVGGTLLLERILAGPHTTGSTGYPRMDAAFDFDRLRRQRHGASAIKLRHGRQRWELPLLDVTREHQQRRDAGEQTIPVARIVGSVDGASQRSEERRVGKE